MYGMRGYRYHRHGWRGPRPFMGFFFIIPVLLMLFIAFTLLKFLWPLLLIGLGIAFLSRRSRGRWGQWDSDWHEKSKHDWDDKPKQDSDDRRYTRTADGDWVEIV
jgi:hypothetical protein